MTIDGSYDITLQTAGGSEAMTLDLRTEGADLRGQARRGAESMELIEPLYSGSHVAFKLKVTTPLPLTLTFEADIEGDLITGTAAVAGMTLPFDGKRV